MYDNCREKAEVYLESANVWYCRKHFFEVAYEMLGPRKIEEKFGKKKLRKIQKMIGVMW
jgi:hypothetical protein